MTSVVCSSNAIDEYVLGECVSILALIPKEYAGSWRIQVFKAALVLFVVHFSFAHIFVRRAVVDAASKGIT